MTGSQSRLSLGTLLPCFCWPPIWETIVSGFPEWGWEGDFSRFPGLKAPLLVWLSWNEIMMILWRIRSSVPRMAKIGGSFFGPNFGLVYIFYKWLYLLLQVECSHYGCLQVRRSFRSFPVARNFLLRALRMFWWTQGMGFFHFAWSHTLVCAVLFQYNSIRKVFCSLRRKAVDCKGQSGTRPKNSIWNLSILVTFLKRFKSKPFSALFVLPLSDLGGEVVIKVTPLVL